MPTDDGLGRKFLGSAGWVLVEQWSTKIVSLLLFAVLARLLTPADFGLVALATSVIAILQVFVNSGFSKALIQKRVLEPKDATTAFWTSLGLAAVVYGLLVLSSPLLAQLFGQPELQSVLVVLGATIPLAALSRVPAALLAREFAFRTLSVRTMLSTLIGAGIALPMALTGFGVWSLVAQALAESAMAVIVLWSSTTWRPTFAFSTASLRSLWKTGTSLLGIELLDALQSQVDKLVVGALFSVSELGIYSLAQRLGLMIQELVSSVITRVSLTTFSRTQDDLQRVNRIFRQLTFATAALSFPVFGLVAVLAPQIVPFLFGPGWDAAIPLIWIMAGGWAFAAVAMFDRSALVGTNHADAALWLALIQNVISIALVFAFAPFGVLGVAFSRFARVITWPIRLYALHRCIRLRVWSYVWQVLKCVIAVLPAVVAIAILQSTPWASVDAAFWAFAVPLGALGMASSLAACYLIADPGNRRAVRIQALQLFKRRGESRA
ncbi:lipopolysaccharide biosynthesis protein [Microbacterium cremeum]|uniref:lipopolysaccharide biosynthesis protein n=1 Tax=Microbacterium cremeum TaxID=2782169 RepID=UPI00188806B9|nr:lipopolysaccharide biosynthesis protein [Microbacterium cremeum]